MRVFVATVAPGIELLIPVDLPDGATVSDALAASRIAERAGFAVSAGACAVFGRRVTPDARLADGDRVEVTRPLACDPKAARHARVRRRTNSERR